MNLRKTKTLRPCGRKHTEHLIEAFRRALARHRRADLIDCLVELARNDTELRRRVAEHLDFDLPRETVAEDNRDLIRRATRVDPRQINRNFDYDHAAYEKVRRNFTSMVTSKRLAQAMVEARLLMELGSVQVEMSDEGLMLDQIEACLRVVLEAVEQSSLPPAKKARWLADLKRADRLHMICEREIKRLAVAR